MKQRMMWKTCLQVTIKSWLIRSHLVSSEQLTERRVDIEDNRSFGEVKGGKHGVSIRNNDGVVCSCGSSLFNGGDRLVYTEWDMRAKTEPKRMKPVKALSEGDEGIWLGRIRAKKNRGFQSLGD